MYFLRLSASDCSKPKNETGAAPLPLPVSLSNSMDEGHNTERARFDNHDFIPNEEIKNILAMQDEFQ